MTRSGIRETDLSELGRRFFAKEENISQVADVFGRDDITAFTLECSESMAELVETLTEREIAYRLPGKPREWDASTDENEFDISEIVTHVVVGIYFYWYSMARTLGHRAPRFPRAPRGAKLTGMTGQIFGRGGWGGVSGPELAEMLRNGMRDFNSYVSGITPEEGKKSSAYDKDDRDGVVLSIDGWLLLLAVHMEMHLKQIRALIEQPDFPSGDREN